MAIVMLSQAAGAGADTNLLEDHWINESKHPTRVDRIAVVGSNVLGDCTLELWYGRVLVAELHPTTVGAVYPDEDDFLTIASGLFCPAGVPIGLQLKDNPTTNALKIVVCVKEMPVKAGGWR